MLDFNDAVEPRPVGARLERYVRWRDIRDAVKGRETDVLDKLGIDWRPHGNAKHVRCPYPNHEDKDPSWRWDQGKARANCSCLKSVSIFDVLMKAEGLGDGDDAFAEAKIRAAELIGREDLIIDPDQAQSSGTKKKKKSAGCSLEAYAKAKGLPIDRLASWGLSNYQNILRIPYCDTSRKVVSVRFRIALEGKDKHRWRKGDKALLYGINHLAVAGSLPVITIVEGESDCFTLWIAGFPAVGLPGAGNWNEERDAHLFDRIPVIYVVIEPDDGGKATLNWLARSRIRERARLIRLNGFKDPNALFLGDPEHFAERWQEALANAGPPPPATGERANAAPLKSLNIGSDVEIAERVAGDLNKEFGEIVFTDGDFYYFDETRWMAIPRHRLRCLVHIYDGAAFMTPKGEESAVKLGKNRVDSVISEMSAKLTQIDFFAESVVGINCSSGFIAFAPDGTPQLQPHNHKHRCRHVLPGTWRLSDGEPPEGSLLQTLLDGVFKDDADAQEKRNLLAEIAGSAALGYATRVKAPKALILKGPNAENGKSQILDACRGLLPSTAISSVTAAKMGDERYVIGLAGKLLNASDELSSSAAIASETFKAVITGEPISGRDVYKSSITFRSVAQNIFACNALPAFKGGMDRGVIRRLVVLVFNRVIPEEERIENIGLRIADEEPDLLLAWAVAGASKLIKNRGFTIPPSSKAALGDWVRDVDPVVAWIAARVAPRVLLIPVPPVPPGAYKTGHAYALFKQWALASGYQAEKLPAVSGFSQRLCAHEPKAFIKHTKVGNWLCGITIGPNDKPDDEVEEVRVTGVDFNVPPVAGAL